MKQLVRSALGALGYDIQRRDSSRHAFTIKGINYEVDPCSVGQTPQGELTAEGAIRLIRERGLKDLRVLDICCGVGIIGLTIFSRLRQDSILKSVAFGDINIFNLNSLHRTLKINKLDGLIGSEIQYWLSDGLKNIPQGEKFDIIVSNPPHFFKSDFTSDQLVPDKLGTYDADWAFHSSFYSRCHDYLTEEGEVWFLENGRAAKESDFKPFIEANPQLQYIKQTMEPLVPDFFWMFTKKSNR